ncbi:putative invertase inhibitor [Macadamia integrifolia]|uniref:putative invertase inhibitor n=1 Tax=Macadamia integrifolia TaxID=60698 RepID=UPI001C4F10A1|nr:putative invertase inhibitor [Macadamia integrifolia]
MRRSLSFFFFLVILILAVVDADNVEDTCQKASQNIKELPYDFCVAVLGENPKSHSADLQSLGIISIELIEANCTKVSSRIAELLNDKKLVRDVKIRLEDCKELYSNAIDQVKPAIDAFKSKDYKSANIEVSAMMEAPTTCEDGFKEEPGLQSPLVAEDNYFFQLTSIALAITTFA